MGHRRVNWSQQLEIVVKDIQVKSRKLFDYFVTNNYSQNAGVFIHTPGRTMPGAPGYHRRTEFDFKVEGIFKHLKSTYY